MSKEPRKLELSVTQVLASALAAIVGAAASARLGTAGTFIGAGVVSVFATVGSAVLGHSLRRGRDKVQVVVQHAVPASRAGHGPDAATQIPTPAEAGPPADPATEDTTELPGAVAAAGAGGRSSHGLAARLADVRWKPVTAIAVLVFAIAVLGITVIELAGGGSLHNIESGKRGGGTSLWHVVGGGGASTTPTQQPGGTSPTPSPVTGSVSATPTVRPTNQPSTSASPTPSTSVSKSPAPTPSRTGQPQGYQTPSPGSGG